MDHNKNARGATSRKFRLMSRLRLQMTVAAATLGALVGSAQADPYSYSRTNAYTYDPSTGLLLTQTLEPNNAQACVVTSYGRDGYGNKSSATVSNCSGATGHAVIAARAASSTYAAVASQTITAGGTTVTVAIPGGAFSDTSINAAGQSERSTYDPRFGVALTTTGPNQLTTNWSYDDFGRKVLEKRADGTSTVFAYCYLASSNLNTTSNSALCASLAFPEAPPNAVLVVHSEPHDGSATPKKNGAFQRIYLDRAGRKIRTVAEAFDATSQVGGSSRWIVQDFDYSAYGPQVVVTQPYFFDRSSSTAAGMGDYGMTRTDYDRLGRPIRNYVADGKGSQTGVSFGSRGSRTASLTTVAYVALTTTTVNDQGQSKVEERSVAGPLLRVTDNLGAQLAQQTDAFGNLVATKDALQNSVALTYDVRGRKIGMNDPDTGTWSYDYDAAGDLVWQQSANQLAAGTATTMSYDTLGRMIQRIDPEYTSNWYYDKYADGSACPMGAGKLCQTTTTNGLSRRYVYDGYGRPRDVRTDVTNGPSFASTTLYDNTNGRIAGQVYPTGLQVNYAYTGNGFLQSVQTATALAITPRPTLAGGSPRSPSQTLPANTALWTLLSTNAWGNAEQSRNNVLTDGSAITTNDAYDPSTGRVLSETAGSGGTSGAMNLAYGWDSLNHVTLRTDNNGAQWVDPYGRSTVGAVTDTLAYDGVGRLQTDTVAAPGINQMSRTVQFQYNALGSLLYKSDVGNYTYVASGAGAVRPHAVQSVSGTYNASYGYDASGNATTATNGAWRSITYNSFNMPDSQSGVQGPYGPQYTWLYDDVHSRFKEVRTNSAGTRTTWMLHPGSANELSFEREEQAAGNSNRHYITVGGATVAVVVTTDALPVLNAATTPPPQTSLNAVKLEFWHTDRQGSLISTTDHAGAITAVYAYDPFGKRRNRDGNYDVSGTLVFDWTTNTDNGTDRGYTGQEHLDDIGLIHMNGRLYDPMIDRFLQGDPFIADPGQLQDYDRFAYCMNNPVTCTDPSGYWHVFGHNILPGVFENKVIVTLAIIIASYYASEYSEEWYAESQGAEAGAAAADTATAAGLSSTEVAAEQYYASSWAYDYAMSSTTASMIGAAAGGATAGFLGSGGELKSTVRGAFTGVIMGGLSSEASNWSTVERVSAKVAVASLIAKAEGGNFKDAALQSLTTNIALESYHYVVGWNPSMAPGESQPNPDKLDCGLEGSNCYKPTSDGKIPDDWKDKNVFGINQPPNGVNDGSKQSIGWLSYHADMIPGMNALAQLHDTFFNANYISDFNTFTNFGSMLPAAIWTYTALSDNLPVDALCPKCKK